MADGLGDFEDQPAQQQQEEDPAAAFLAREQDELAGIEDDDVAGSQEETPAAPAQGGGGDSGSGAADWEGEQQNGDIFGADQGGPQSNGPVPTPAPRREEPEKIRKWREEQKAMLEKKDAEAERLREEWKKEAADELRKWYAQREEQLEKTKASNRVANKELLKQLEDDALATHTRRSRTSAEEAFREEVAESNPGQEWERVARMCDFNPKSSKGSKDTGRMRSILLHLKQEGLQR
ncbi:clathrin light chain B-like isoform X2 [Branchiostoma floridae]|uniref:Clathrin light chain n=1 Tax=Branchiostoma floridae TaxID=7739 RepID=A0A9J7LGE9_BRAFL|nr:clathrin light chain B-like isoform X2 [Branchiostoma floridae]